MTKTDTMMKTKTDIMSKTESLHCHGNTLHPLMLLRISMTVHHNGTWAVIETTPTLSIVDYQSKTGPCGYKKEEANTLETCTTSLEMFAGDY